MDKAVEEGKEDLEKGLDVLTQLEKDKKKDKKWKVEARDEISFDTGEELEGIFSYLPSDVQAHANATLDPEECCNWINGYLNNLIHALPLFKQGVVKKQATNSAKFSKLKAFYDGEEDSNTRARTGNWAPGRK